MNKKIAGFALMIASGSLMLGGCATTGSVKRAQARADQAFIEGQKGQELATRAQGSADAAMGAAQHAQGSADQAGSAAQSAGAAAQQANAAAAANAQGSTAQIASLTKRLHKLEVAEWKRKHPAKKHHHHHKAVKPAQH